MKVIEYDDYITESVLNGTYNQTKWTKKDSLVLLFKIAGLLISVTFLYRDWGTDITFNYILIEIIFVLGFLVSLLMSCGIVDIRTEVKVEKK